MILFQLVLILFLCGSLSAQSIDTFIDSLLQSPVFSGASVSVLFREAQTGKTVAGKNGGLRLAPASNMKVISTASALMSNGPEKRYVTRVMLCGKQEGTTLFGDICIYASGDPTLGSQYLAGNPLTDSICRRIAGALLAKNIRHINGTVKVIDSGTLDVPPDYYPAIDMGNYYGAVPAEFCIGDNLYYLSFKPGKNVGDAAAIHSVVPQGIDITFLNEMKTGPLGSGDNGYIYRGFGSKVARCIGTIPLGKDTFAIKGSMPDPAEFFEKYLLSFLKQNNLSFRTGKPTAQTKSELLTEFVSPPLNDIIFIVNKRSNNLYAEQLLLGLLPDTVKQRNINDAINVQRELLTAAGIPVKTVSIQDGSGLSRNNQVTTTFITDVLNYMSKHTFFRQYVNSFPLAGDPTDLGSFKEFGLGTGLEKNARIKSGLIEGVRGLSGYFTAKSGTLISFSCLSNNHQSSTKSVDAVFQAIMQRVYNEY